MGVTINGDSIIISNATIELVNGVNTETGVAYIIITPSGGVGALPFMATGPSGQPTLFPSITYLEIPAADPLPIPNPVSTLLDAGGAGLPAKYALTFYGHAGATGLTGTSTIATATDLAITPALGVGTEKFMLLYRNSDGKWVPTAQKIGFPSAPSIIAATAYNNAATRLLASRAIAAQPFDWIPRVYASTIVTGTDGPTPTRVDLVARLNDAAAGPQLGYTKGLIGANATGVQTVLLPTYLHDQAIPASYARVAAGDPATVHLRAEQGAASSSSWSTPASPDTVFGVEVQPLI